MDQIFDLPEESLKQLRKFVSDDAVMVATDQALAMPPRKCRGRAACVHRLILTDDQRQGILAKLKILLAQRGFEEGGMMLPIGHVYEGLIQTFSRDSRVIV